MTKNEKLMQQIPRSDTKLYSQSTTASHVLVVAVQQILFREGHELASINKLGPFQGSGGRKGPTGSTRTLGRRNMIPVLESSSVVCFLFVATCRMPMRRYHGSDVPDS